MIANKRVWLCRNWTKQEADNRLVGMNWDKVGILRRGREANSSQNPKIPAVPVQKHLLCHHWDYKHGESKIPLKKCIMNTASVYYVNIKRK